MVTLYMQYNHQYVDSITGPNGFWHVIKFFRLIFSEKAWYFWVHCAFLAPFKQFIRYLVVLELNVTTTFAFFYRNANAIATNEQIDQTNWTKFKVTLPLQTLNDAETTI